MPAAYVPLQALPRTPNGKLDRHSLPAPDTGPGPGYEPPQGPIESALSQIWAELLQLERVGRHDDFFALGGHSLLGMRVVMRVRQSLKLEVKMSDVFMHPVLSDLARVLEGAAQAVLPPIGRADRGARVPLSFAQQRLWFLTQLEGVSEAYQLSFGLLLEGPLDEVALRRALDRIVARHESLRTTFGFDEGAPVQRIAPIEESRFHLIEHDLRGHDEWQSELMELSAKESRRAFDMERGPLIRGYLVKLSEHKHALRVTMHHIVTDGWSLGLLANELSVLYGAFCQGREDPLPELPIQYADYALWQQHWIEGEVLHEQGEYWKGALSGAPALLELPTDHARPAQQEYAGDYVGREFDASLTAGLRALSQRHGVTLHMTLLAAWAVLLGRLSGQQDIVIGTPVANRRQLETEKLIGFFVNTLALRVDLSGSPTVRELLQRVKSQSLAAQQHQDIPFEQVVELMRPVRSLAHSPLFQVMLQWQNRGEGGVNLAGLKALRSPRSGARRMSKFDQTLSLSEVGDRIVGGLEYASSLFERATIERHLQYFGQLLEAMVADEEQRIDRLSLLSAAQRHQVLYGWNQTRAAVPDCCIHQLFEAQVDSSPDAVALLFEEAQLSYAQLNAQANRLAHRLRGLGVKPDARVAICVQRGMEMVVALLAVLKAGGAYVPLDPGYPPARLRMMLEDAAPVMLLTQRSLRELLAAEAAKVPVLLLDDAPDWQEEPQTNLDPQVLGLRPEHLAYVIYTSGSTGEPKGVAIEHRNTVNLLSWGRSAFAREVLSQTLCSTSLNFDLAVYECLLPLTVGGAVRVVPNVLYLEQRHSEVTLINTVPSAMQALLQGRGLPSSVRTVNLAGEPLRRQLVERIFASTEAATVCNLYGPSETTTYSTWSAIERGQDTVPHIGRPIANTQIYLLDACGEPVPVGVTGDLYIGGAGVARGYLKRPELTEQRFLRDPFAAEPGARMYRTGDLGRWLADGNIEFLGRNDFQVKVRGFRIELGEIEARLHQHPGVGEVVVIAREDAAGEKRLVAYYTAGSRAAAAGAEELRAHLSAVLPEYMVPAAYVPLQALPRTPNGKLDRHSLPAPDTGPGPGYEPPQGPIESALSQIWAELLQLERVGRHDDFFALGGHSLLVMKVVALLRQRDMTIAPRDLFVRPILKELAAHIGSPEPLFPDKAICVREGGSESPLFLAHDGTDSLHYVYALSPYLSADLPLYGLPAAPPEDLRFPTIEDLASRMVKMIREVQPEGPYRVAGWCTGGVLAYAIANQLLGADQAVDFLGLFDTVYLAGLGPSTRRSVDQAAPVFEEKSYLMRLIQSALRPEDEHLRPTIAEIQAGMASVDFADLVRMCNEASLLRRDLAGLSAVQVKHALIRRHAYTLAQIRYRAPKISIPMHLFLAQNTQLKTPLLGWQDVLPKPQIHTVTVPGDHYSIMGRSYIATLAVELSNALPERVKS